MDYSWSKTRPRYLYRVYHPNTANSYPPSSGGQSLSKIKTKYQKFISYDEGENLEEFLQTIRSHHNQFLDFSPYISFFSDKVEAVQWTLAARLVSRGTTRLLTIDITRERVRVGMTLWKLQDIQDKIG
ncbi:hypothetical protein WAI453_001148 [Rhynchosporium graminicola]|uniref:DUF7587 domain-containing protein n=1 Tax=Rhynchosporium graminicola TaxID=2792576 RepID=A0A1E1K6P0_9HELO|nr:uncharacterized protein RCO7_09484 [Rhynchosporium commune]